MAGSTSRAGRLLLPLSLGIADGILNALTLASGSVLHGRGLDGALAIRVGLVAFVSALFTVFVAEYAQLRAELARAERQLSLTTSGRLAAGRLGRQVAGEAAAAAAVASVASLAGATVPLLIGVAVPEFSWVAIVVSVLGLGGLGISLATVVGGRRARWAVLLMAAGVAVAVLGVVLDIT